MTSLFRTFVGRIDIFAILSIIVPLFVYLLTLAPSVTFFDSGEFITAIHSLGIAHSPGYPLFINYAKPFTWLPFGNIAFRVNVATAISASLACYGVYLLVSYCLAMERFVADLRFSGQFKQCVALASALAFAFSPRLWLQSNHDKPYPLISFMAAIIFYLLLLWRDRYAEGDERPHYVYIGAFLCGLATGAHQTIVLLLPPYAYLILSKNWRLIGRVKEFLIAVTFGIIGFSIHLHLPFRALSNPLLNWGDPKNIDLFLWNLLRKGYPSEPPDRNLLLLWKQLKAFNIVNEFTWVGLGLLLVGVFAFMKNRRDEFVAYALGIVCSLLVIVGYFNAQPDLIFLTEEFFTPLYLLTAVFIGLGLFYLLKKCVESLPVDKLTALPIKVVAAIFLLLLPSAICARNYYENDQHENYVAFDYATNTFRSLPQGTALFTWGDSGAFPLWYLQGVEKMREDLDLLHTPHLVFNWYLDAFPDLFRYSALRTISPESMAPDAVLKLAVYEQIARRPVFVDFSTRYSITFDEYGIRQRGICYQLIKDSESIMQMPDSHVWDVYSSRGFTTSQMGFRDLDTGKAILIYATSLMESGDAFMRMGRRDEGAFHIEKAVLIAPEMRGQAQQILNTYGVR